MLASKIKSAATVIGVLAALTALVLPASSGARTLSEVKARGVLALCANPNALPYSSDDPDRPGFQVEIARALARGLGVEFKVDWIIPTYRANLVNCDLHMDAYNDPKVHEGKLKLSHPYQRTGVGLGLRPATETYTRFRTSNRGSE